MRIQITSDSTCDLSRAQIERYHIAILPLGVTMDDKAYLDGVDIAPQDIYAHVDRGGALPATAAVNMMTYHDLFAKYAHDCDAVIHLNISSDMSCCNQNANLAAQDFDNVYVVDSRNLSTGHGLLVLKAAQLAESGLDAREIVSILNDTVEKVEASFILDRLDYMKKGGRCSTITVLGANLLKLKPCIEVKDGNMGVGKKYRGSFEKCLKDYLTDRLKDRTDLDLGQVFLTHSGLDKAYEQLAVDTVRQLQPFENLTVTTAGCTISSHCGPGTIGVLFIRK